MCVRDSYATFDAKSYKLTEWFKLQKKISPFNAAINFSNYYLLLINYA